MVRAIHRDTSIVLSSLQILRLNERLIEKDHMEFERGESSNSAVEENFELLKELEFYKKETKLLRNQVGN